MSNHRIAATDPSRRLPISRLNEIKVQRRQERAEQIAALRAGYVDFGSVLSHAADRGTAIRKVSLYDLLVNSGMPPRSARQTIRRMTERMNHPVDKIRGIRLQWLVDERTRRTRVLMLADALYRQRRVAPRVEFPFASGRSVGSGVK